MTSEYLHRLETFGEVQTSYTSPSLAFAAFHLTSEGQNLVVIIFSAHPVYLYLTPICLSSSKFHELCSATEISLWSYAKCLDIFKKSATQRQIINKSCACSSKLNDSLDFVAFCYVRPSTRIFCIINQKIHTCSEIRFLGL